MKPELKDLLLEHYGELMYDKANSNDYFKNRRIESKMNAINLLLDLPLINVNHLALDPRVWK